jgi:hypothetical protein
VAVMLIARIILKRCAFCISRSFSSPQGLCILADVTFGSLTPGVAWSTLTSADAAAPAPCVRNVSLPQVQYSHAVLQVTKVFKPYALGRRSFGAQLRIAYIYSGFKCAPLLTCTTGVRVRAPNF